MNDKNRMKLENAITALINYELTKIEFIEIVEQIVNNEKENKK